MSGGGIKKYPKFKVPNKGTFVSTDGRTIFFKSVVVGSIREYRWTDYLFSKSVDIIERRINTSTLKILKYSSLISHLCITSKEYYITSYCLSLKRNLEFAADVVFKLEAKHYRDWYITCVDRHETCEMLNVKPSPEK